MTHPDRYQPTDAASLNRAAITSQATAIEQSRAVAEVQAAVLVAQQRPRNRAAAIAEMRDATAQMSVASRAYYRYRRGGENVTGVSIHLARELARCWGNIDYCIKELRRDDVKGESEMLAHAWDMQTNARASTTFIVPHVRDTRDGAKKLTETRDIYENNANAGARRLREQILAVLPSWFVEEAKANCDETLEGGGGKPLPQRIADAIRGYEQIGITCTQLEAKVGRSAEEWSGHDVGQLGVIFQSIKRSETTIADEFPTTDSSQEGVAAEEITAAGRRKRAPSAPKPSAEDASAPSNEEAKPDNAQVSDTEDEPPTSAAKSAMASTAQQRRITKLLADLGAQDDNDRSIYLSRFFERDITSAKQLTAAEANEVITELTKPPAPDSVAEATGDGQQ
ncbi:hypothetical protein IU421_13490 [Nocardia cyriacigeorgica]|uniref:hypothetical protein n=1 Tax=Nocardia cyriacigeorgica TaxID=135487 RepID=UPI00189486C6|nr:hypothetical protein [Nocardia cyriacigeorgica]MBF6515295.1 hypothetical protein [Nocardia cyriacigeorgica]